ncbi:guanine nucleotide-binding protein-like 1 [Macrobrachium nipponense]|uniref:guanine nucleotide-binding protein-like 1 n=1 Tax=Macrobrachium nipponense TaxID=159736 RepID=UPI0030C874CA
MPQFKRKVAFSGKKKKEQIHARRARRMHTNADDDNADFHTTEASIASPEEGMDYQEEVLAINYQPGVNARVNRYNLKFRKEKAAEKEKRQALHSKPVTLLSENEMETGTECFYPPGLSYPSRPPWRSNMSKKELDMNENKYFRLFCEKIDKEFSKTSLSMYELNLETWRQLWRVTEMSDIMLIIVDARFPVAQFPPYLYHHLVEKENKGIILIMNKADLLPPSLILAWEHYFAQHFPKLIVVPFSSLEGYKGRKCLLRMAAESALCLVDACQKLVDDSVNLKPWREKIEEERDLASGDDQSVDIQETNVVHSQNTAPETYQRYRDGILTIGTIGHPNVGKSSLINALMGKKVVSVSRTPGHTKHFQTIFLTKNIKLCDCPGLVFPSTVDMPLQVLLGSFPVAQVRDPIGVVHYIASRLDVPKILKLHLSEGDEDSEWTSYLICKAWAEKRGYRTKSRGVEDASRAANEILRFCLNGYKSLVIYQRPPGFSNDKGKYESASEIHRIKLIQGVHSDAQEELSQDEEEENVEENVDTVSEEEKEEKDESNEESEDDDYVPISAVQNKFALLNDED